MESEAAGHRPDHMGETTIMSAGIDRGPSARRADGGSASLDTEDYCYGCGTRTTIDQHSKLCPPCYMLWPYQPVMGAAPDRCEHCGAPGPAGRHWWNCRGCGRYNANPDPARMRPGVRAASDEFHAVARSKD